ncbi:MAG: thiol-activated cytolysin family protein [Gammaproteobacteria bacterium]|nr:thiol-activated cytolysin family protein [Gammaproteobacteria bacterium]
MVLQNKFKKHAFRKIVTMAMLLAGTAACDSSDGVAPQDLPTSTITYSQLDIPVGQAKETLLAEDTSWETVENVPMDYDPASDDEQNATDTLLTSRSRCTSKTYKLEANPEQIVMFGNTDGNYSWPGAILQGNPFRSVDGTLAALSVDPLYRTPVTITVTNLHTTNSSGTSRTIESPSLSTTSTAINDIVVDVFTGGIPSGDSTHLTIEETKDIGSFFLKAGFSGKTKYGLAKVKAKLDASMDIGSEKHNIVIRLTQKLYDVEVQQPPKPEDWFTGDFYGDELTYLKERSEISEDNPPIYVSKVTYGRMAIATISSTASKTEIEAAISASYKALTTSGTVNLNSRYSKIIENASKEVISLGGDGALATNALNTGDWSTFFSEGVEVTEAVPLTVSFKNLYDNSPAGVTESTEYTDTVCEPYQLVAGTYDFQTPQVHSVPDGMSGANDVVAHDLNNDGIQDLVWNNHSGTENQVYLTMGTASGAFKLEDKVCVVAPGTEEPMGQCDFGNGKGDWSLYKLHPGDMNGDGYTDLIWINKYQTATKFGVRYVLGSVDGFLPDSFAETSITHGLPSIKDEALRVLDFDGNGTAEIIARSNVDEAYDELGIRISKAGFNMFSESLSVYTPSFSSGVATYTSVINNVFHIYNNAADNAWNNSKSYLYITDIDGDGSNDTLVNYKGISLSDYGQENNLLWGNKYNDFMSGSLVTLDTDTRPIEHSGHSRKDKVFWESSIPVLGSFTGVGSSMIWVRIDTGNIESVYWDPAMQTWQENTNVLVFDWLDPPTNLLGKMTEEQMYVLDIDDDKKDDISFTVVTGANNEELWFGTVGANKNRSASPDLLDVTTVNYQKHPTAKNWNTINFRFSGRYDSDTRDDIVLVQTGNPGKIYVARAKAEGM